MGGQNLDFNEKLADELKEGYYHWYGSLTPPPCTEGVNWNVLKKVETVCQRQVDVLKAALGATQSGLAFNNRVPQPLNHRVVSMNGIAEASNIIESTAEPVLKQDVGNSTDSTAESGA